MARVYKSQLIQSDLQIDGLRVWFEVAGHTSPGQTAEERAREAQGRLAAMIDVVADKVTHRVGYFPASRRNGYIDPARG